MVVGIDTQLTLVDHDTVGKCGAVHIGILGDVYPMVVNDIMVSLLGNELQAMGLHEPFVASLLVTMHHTIVIVDIGAKLSRYINLAEPMLTVVGSHLIG
jgi:hypothetical protein